MLSDKNREFIEAMRIRVAAVKTGSDSMDPAAATWADIFLSIIDTLEADNAALRKELRANAQAWREWSEDATTEQARRIFGDNAESIERLLQTHEH